MIGPEVDGLPLRGRGTVHDLDGHFFEKLTELRRKLLEGQLNQFGELVFADSVGHGYNLSPLVKLARGK